MNGNEGERYMKNEKYWYGEKYLKANTELFSGKWAYYTRKRGKVPRNSFPGKLFKVNKIFRDNSCLQPTNTIEPHGWNKQVIY